MEENNNNEIIEGEKISPADSQGELVEGKKPIEINTSATFNPETGKWEGYRPEKGKTPPWKPFDAARRKNRVTLRERKFMMMLSTTGKMQEAYRAVYTVKDYGSPKITEMRVAALANQVLRRIRKKAPELVAALTFEDITPDFVKKEMLKLYNNSESSIHEKTRLLELMGKTQAMFTDKIQTETKVREIIGTVYKESEDDFPEQDNRIGRIEMNDLIDRA